eukprot:152766-Hanusia_phi.AAC.2
MRGRKLRCRVRVVDLLGMREGVSPAPTATGCCPPVAARLGTLTQTSLRARSVLRDRSSPASELELAPTALGEPGRQQDRQHARHAFQEVSLLSPRRRLVKLAQSGCLPRSVDPQHVWRVRQEATRQTRARTRALRVLLGAIQVHWPRQSA